MWKTIDKICFCSSVSEAELMRNGNSSGLGKWNIWISSGYKKAIKEMFHSDCNCLNIVWRCCCLSVSLSGDVKYINNITPALPPSPSPSQILSQINSSQNQWNEKLNYFVPSDGSPRCEQWTVTSPSGLMFIILVERVDWYWCGLWRTAK